MRQILKSVKVSITGVLCILLSGIIITGCSGVSNDPANSGAEASAKSGDEEAVSNQEDYGKDEYASDVILDREGAVAPSEKSETVNIEADETGTPKKVTVETALTLSSDSAVVLDETGLFDIKNKNGDEEYNILDDGTILWENHGENIRYEGSYDGDIPVGVRLSYYLEGEEMSPEEIAGKTGNVKIRFDYENKTMGSASVEGKDYKEAVPMAALSMMILSEDHFTDIKIDHGKIMEMDGENIVLGYTVPGLYDSLKLGAVDRLSDTELPDFIEVSAYATDFSLDYTATVFSTGLFSELKDEDIDEIEELSDSLSELDGAADELTDAVTEMKSGASQYQTYLNSYVEGVNSLAAGIATLNESVSAMGGAVPPELAANIAALNAGAAQLSASGSAIRSGYSAIASGISELAEGLGEFEDEDTGSATKDDEGLKDTVARVRALKKIENDYKCISGVTDGTASSVRFIIETDEVK